MFRNIARAGFAGYRACSGAATLFHALDVSRQYATFVALGGRRCRAEDWRSLVSGAMCSGGGTRSRRPVGRRCRPEVGVPLPAVPCARVAIRDLVARSGDGADRRSAFPCRRCHVLGWQYAISSPGRATVPTGGRRSLAGGAMCSGGNTRSRRPVGRRCRPEAGVPLPAAPSARVAVRVLVALSGDGADRRSAFPCLRCHALRWQYAISSPCRATVPTGGRRSLAGGAMCSGGNTRSRRPVGRRCRPEVGVPLPARRGAGVKTGGPWPPAPVRPR